MTDLLQTPKPLGGFRTILADPPWAFVTRTGKHVLPQRASAGQHYPTMSRAELNAMRSGVLELAAKDCALIMWIVDSHLTQGLELGLEWGFNFKTKLFTWLKTNAAMTDEPMGMGHWSRKQTEQAYLFTRGRPPRLNAGVREIIRAPTRQHSRKPDQQYEAVEMLVGGPYLELFSRSERRGWTAWGNDVGKFGAAQQVPEEERIAGADARQD